MLPKLLLPAVALAADSVTVSMSTNVLQPK